MPAKSQAQQRLMAACEHGAGWSSCPNMTHQQFHDFAATPRTGLPVHVRKKYDDGGVSDYDSAWASMSPPHGTKLTTANLSGIMPPITNIPMKVPQGFNNFPPEIQDAYNKYSNAFSSGSITWPQFQQSMRQLGIGPGDITRSSTPVNQMQTGGMAQQGNTDPLPSSQYGSDTIPAALTPGEMILTPDQQSAVAPIPGQQHKLKPDQLAKFHAIHGSTNWAHVHRTGFQDGGVASLEQQYQNPDLSYEERRAIYLKILQARGITPSQTQPPNMATPTPTPFKNGGVVWFRRFHGGGNAGDGIEISGQDPFGSIPHGFGPASNTSPKAQGPPDQWSPPGDLNQNPDKGDAGRGGREGWYNQGWDSWSGAPTLSGLYGQPQSFGTSPDVNYGAFGDTKLPTWWVNYPDVGNVPMAIPYGPAAGTDNYGSGEKDD
jgi:hypothetical protein